MSKSYFYILFILISIFFTGCKSKKPLTRGEKATSTHHLIKLIQETEPHFKTLNANSISVNFNMDGETRSVSASLRIITDSVIVLSIYPFLGIELYSMELYPEKWILYDKMNRNYVTDNYDYLYYVLGINVDFYSFQSLFSANLFTVGEREVNAARLQFRGLEAGKNEIVYETSVVKQTNIIYNSHVINKVLLQSKKDNYLLTISYNDYIVSKNMNYPRNIVIDANTEDTNVSLDMKIQKVTFNNELKINLSNPERYTRTTLDQLIKK